MADTIQPGDDILLTWEGREERKVDKVTTVEGGAIGLQGGGYIRDDLVKRNADGVWSYCYDRSGS